MARRRAQDYDAKRQAILHKSAELFAQFGYPGTSITMIAEACGASKALLYHYYPDKEAVLFDILSNHLEQLIGAVERALDGAEKGERIYAIATALLESYRNADAEHQIQIANLKLLPEDKQEALRLMERRLVMLFADAIAEEVPQIGRGPLLKPLTMSAFGMLNWHYLWFRDGKGLSRAEYARLVGGLIITGARGAGEAVEAMPAKARAGAGPRPALSARRTAKMAGTKTAGTKTAGANGAVAKAGATKAGATKAAPVVTAEPAVRAKTARTAKTAGAVKPARAAAPIRAAKRGRPAE